MMAVYIGMTLESSCPSTSPSLLDPCTHYTLRFSAISIQGSCGIKLVAACIMMAPRTD